MKCNLSDKIHRMNYLISETDALYHQACLKIGLADSVMRVLYTIHDHGESCLLSDIYKGSGISKQTVNTAIRKLEKDEILYLEQYKGRAKRVCLTEQGKEYVLNTAARIFATESEVFSSWSQEEIDAYIHLLEKYMQSFQKQLTKL